MEKEKIYKGEFIKILMKVFPYSDKDRQYLMTIFEHDLVDGLTKFEIKQKLAQVKYNYNDPVYSGEADKIRNKLLAALGD